MPTHLVFAITGSRFAFRPKNMSKALSFKDGVSQPEKTSSKQVQGGRLPETPVGAGIPKKMAARRALLSGHAIKPSCGDSVGVLKH